MKLRQRLPLLVLLVVSSAFATDAMAQPQKRGPAKEESKLGDYAGVKAGNSSITPPGARRKGKRGRSVYWLGFQPKVDGSARLFLQLGVEVETLQWLEGSTLVVHLGRTRIGNRTVQRYLNTRFFDTAVAHVRARTVPRRRAKGSKPAHDRGLQLRIDFVNPEDAGQASMSNAEADGFHYLYLDFAPGTDA